MRSLMAAVITLHPINERGNKILDELERRTSSKPIECFPDGTRSYFLNADNATRDAFDAMLEEIDSSWADHVINTTPM